MTHSLESDRKTQPKYQTKNPISRYLVGNFFKTFRSLVGQTQPQTIIEIGSAEGYLSHELTQVHPQAKIHALDINMEMYDPAKMENVRFILGKAEALPFPKEQFDLVVCCEVLEHILHPDRALPELHRITKDWTLISVPLEPLWRILNISRGAFLRSWGNTPGHLQHWSKTDFVHLLAPYFEIKAFRYCLPWQFALCRKR